MVTTEVRCPRCGKEVDWEGNPFRPFCSDRCRMIDLGKWMEGNYIIPGESPDGKELDEEEDLVVF